MGVFGFFKKQNLKDAKTIVSCDNQTLCKPVTDVSGYNDSVSANPVSIVSRYNQKANFKAAEAVNLPAKDYAPLTSTVDSLPAAVRAKAQERLAFVQLVKSTIKTRCGTAPDAVLYVATNNTSQFPLLCQAGKNGASALLYNNYRNWSKRTRDISGQDEKLRALCDDYARGYMPRKGCDKFWEYLHAFYLNRNSLPLKQAYRLACAKIRELDKTTIVPTFAQANYQITRLDPAMLILAREGEEAYKNRCVDFIRRDWSRLMPGECIIGDSRLFDTRVKVWDDARKKWIAVRPTVAGLLDARSWYLPAYWITVEPVNSLTLIDTLRLYFRASGGVAPAHVYFDNGKDYCAQGFSTDFDADGTPHSIFRELNIKLINSIAYNARAKTIERAFRDMMQQFDKLFPDYLGSRPGQRTIAADYYDTHAEELPSLRQFCEIFHRWLSEWHNTPKQGDIHKGQSPAEIWEKLDHSAAISPERLKMAFFKPEALRKVTRGPSITWNKKYYYSDALRWGDKVLVKSDAMDPDHVICCRPDGAYICEARTRDRIQALALDSDDARKAISDSIAHQRRQLRDTCTMIDDLTGGKHLASPLELMLAEDGAKIISGATIGSVKGAAHSYTHHSIPGVIEFQEDKKEDHEQNPPLTEPDRELEALVEKALTGGFENNNQNNFEIPTIKEKENDNNYELANVF